MRMQWLAVLLLCGSPAIADCKTETDQKRNADGSELRITQTQCDQQNQRTTLIELRADPFSPYKTVLLRKQSLSEFPRGFGHLKDIDDDGILEYDEVESCGAGPNCWHNIFRIDPKQSRAWLLLKGGFSYVRKISDFYVTSGRSSCCSWTHQIYRAPAQPRGMTEQDLLYSVYLKGPIDGSATPTCRISRPANEEWEQANLPNPKLLMLCEGYGSDVVINPEQTEGER